MIPGRLSHLREFAPGNLLQWREFAPISSLRYETGYCFKGQVINSVWIFLLNRVRTLGSRSHIPAKYLGVLSPGKVFSQ